MWTVSPYCLFLFSFFSNSLPLSFLYCMFSVAELIMTLWSCWYYYEFSFYHFALSNVKLLNLWPFAQSTVPHQHLTSVYFGFDFTHNAHLTTWLCWNGLAGWVGCHLIVLSHNGFHKQIQFSLSVLTVLLRFLNSPSLTTFQSVKQFCKFLSYLQPFITLLPHKIE